jgi:hypothetical protein
LTQHTQSSLLPSTRVWLTYATHRKSRSQIQSGIPGFALVLRRCPLLLSFCQWANVVPESIQSREYIPDGMDGCFHRASASRRPHDVRFRTGSVGERCFFRSQSNRRELNLTRPSRRRSLPRVLRDRSASVPSESDRCMPTPRDGPGWLCLRRAGCDARQCHRCAVARTSGKLFETRRQSPRLR